jgi:hypothetical protein
VQNDGCGGYDAAPTRDCNANTHIAGADELAEVAQAAVQVTERRRDHTNAPVEHGVLVEHFLLCIDNDCGISSIADPAEPTFCVHGKVPVARQTQRAIHTTHQSAQPTAQFWMV